MLEQFKDWITHPWRNDMKFTTIVVLVVLFIVVCLWSTDGIRILQKGITQ